MKKKRIIEILGTAVAILVMATSVPIFATDLGGWDEEEGSFSLQNAEGYSLQTQKVDSLQNDISNISTTKAKSTAKHTGKSEKKLINGTTNKRAHGWTTWKGVYHYTTAQMKRYGKVVTTDTDWDTGGTEAISPWLAFDGESLGHAKTFYGN
ncbi:hypothetical protein [Anaerovorax odorimutans]|uniref:hypothetical protein n=1 Tax=Anaerovorax odorimutans TaxID=109327 RepID=UPI000423F83D|nr:hypothetical protein [Anaerovorax odorimutans]